MALSKRLFSIFQMVEKGSIAADIGCDHGLLSIALIQEDICSHVYACDLRKGPLSRAQNAIHQLGLDHKITTLLCDGLKAVPDVVDTIIIAGMGADTIQGILERDLKRLPSFKRIIVQSNKHVDDIRRWISNHHFCIEMEDIVEEDHFYEVVAFSCKENRTLSEDEILFGTNQNLELFEKYWTHRLEKVEKIMTQMPSTQDGYHDFELLRDRIKEKLQMMRNHMKLPEQ